MQADWVGDQLGCNFAEKNLGIHTELVVLPEQWRQSKPYTAFVAVPSADQALPLSLRTAYTVTMLAKVLVLSVNDKSVCIFQLTMNMIRGLQVVTEGSKN